ncbi:hypothetical protein P3X46_021583 [Hevea brasiliensis]|uniref:Uncharacterized protein n=2 Tax=Hevea brasiliensis TaxID=3981 RepID=A0ABQ9LG17_HEVBR|nr:hypothetical protein P3X46_021583 [Hevea brasiliensis]
MPLMYKNPRSHANLSVSNSKPSQRPLLPPPNRHLIGHESHLNPTPTTLPSSLRIMLAAISWLRSRRIRCLFLILCSPILLPFLCASFPLLCAVELCIRTCRRSRRKKEGNDEKQLRRCEEGFCDCDRLVEEEKEVGLLQRYLEDQLRLVGSMYECGDEFDCPEEEDTADFKTPLLG